jgi:TRAP-type C4-dicarboxylate transport system permease small subunit
MDPIKANSSDIDIQAIVNSWAYKSALPVWVLYRIALLEREIARLTNRVSELEAAADTGWPK